MLNGNKQDFILLVTNNDKLKNSVYNAIEADYNLICVRTVEEALSVITLKLPNIFIADVDTEYSNGLELVKRLRDGIKTRLTPSILISSKEYKGEKIKAIEKGADDYLTFPFDEKELKAIVKLRLNKFKEFYLLSVTDELTRLYNRKEFINKFQNEINQYPNKTLSLSILDIDFFKKVNDTYGHQTGDIVLMRLADLLKQKTSDNFFPARFGGEEFVILHPGLNMKESKKIMDELLQELQKIKFKHKKSQFTITFSAGIAEYPLLSRNVSELLSRSDQALYSAKEEGRNRVYIFDEVMSRNDKFWNHLNSNKSYYVNKKGNDLTTGLPFLPNVLEEIMMTDFNISSIGLIIIQVSFISNLQTILSRENIQYDVENIKMIIGQSCKKGFPSDIHIAISDFFKLEFIVLFPSISDFSTELKGFNEICLEIGETINRKLSEFNADISYNSGVLFKNDQQPYKLYNDIDSIRNNTKELSRKNLIYSKYLDKCSNPGIFDKLEDIFKIKYFYDSKDGTKLFQYLRLKEMEKNCIISHFFRNIINTAEDFILFLKGLNKSGVLNKEVPLLFAYFPVMDIDTFTKTLSKEMEGYRIVLLISENQLMDYKDELLLIRESLPENISLGLRDSYIDKDILCNLSIFEFDIIMFSDNILRNIHFFKDRINIVNGLKLFLDQVGIPSLASGISLEEEFILLNDLNFSIFSGKYVENKFS